ncbi:MAG: hypothetical protein WBD95_06765 [Xanthobacteraceae bacterium]
MFENDRKLRNCLTRTSRRGRWLGAALALAAAAFAAETACAAEPIKIGLGMALSGQNKQVIVTPARYKTGDVIHPYADAKQ